MNVPLLPESNGAVAECVTRMRKLVDEYDHESDRGWPELALLALIELGDEVLRAKTERVKLIERMRTEVQRAKLYNAFRAAGRWRFTGFRGKSI